jgi:hypothetical protein
MQAGAGDKLQDWLSLGKKCLNLIALDVGTARVRDDPHASGRYTNAGGLATFIVENYKITST